jgi:hypothetical protein
MKRYAAILYKHGQTLAHFRHKRTGNTAWLAYNTVLNPNYEPVIYPNKTLAVLAAEKHQFNWPWLIDHQPKAQEATPKPTYQPLTTRPHFNHP